MSHLYSSYIYTQQIPSQHTTEILQSIFFIAVLFTVDREKKWNQTSCSSPEEWTKKLLTYTQWNFTQ